MAGRPRGGYIGFNRVPAASAPSSAASGVWTLQEAESLVRAGTWPTVTPASSVTLLLSMDGTNGSTTFTDSSATPKTVTAFGNAQISTTQAKFGGASGYFDGNGDYLTVSSHPTIGTQDFTIEFWLYPNVLSGIQIYVDFRPDNGLYPLLYSDGSTLHYYTSSTNRISGTLTVTQWQHVAVSRSGTSTKMFINGTQVGSTYTDNNNYAASTPTIGKSFDDFYFNAYMDDLRILVGTGGGRYVSNFTAPTSAHS